MSAGDGVVSRYSGDPVEATDPREDLVRRVVSSSTFEKSPRLRAFLLYVCRCALDDEPTAATEHQIGINVFGRSAGYNPNEDNIVRSQARLLRLKLEHHFANEGRDEPITITIPKGRYLPVFEKRFAETIEPKAPADIEPPAEAHRAWSPLLLVSLLVVLGLVGIWVASIFHRTKPAATLIPRGNSSAEIPANVGGPVAGNRVALPAEAGEVRIAAGTSGSAYTDVRGHVWDADRFYQGGISASGPQDFFPPVPDAGIFRTVREGAAQDAASPQLQGGFRYDIPVKPGVYELRLYFADPVRHTAVANRDDAQNLRHFQVNVNGRPLLSGFDPIADAGSAPVDIRAFKDISPLPDGKVHLEFMPGPERPFVNALELTPGTPGKLKPIRVSAHASDFVDKDGIHWSADRYFIGGRTSSFANSGTSSKFPELYTVERFGNFSYAIPVPPGSYTVKLHFFESFFSNSNPTNGLCQGVGCRVFDVTCNGTTLLHHFDIFEAGGGPFRPVVRTFQHLHPNGQGKLLLSFSPVINYAEVRAIEVIDEAP